MPRTLTSKVAAGSAIAGPTRVWAARWKTTSNSPASTVAPTRCGVAQVGLDQLDLRRNPLQGQPRERRRRQVEDGDGVAALQQRPRQVRGDEAVAAGDQRPLHGASTRGRVPDPPGRLAAGPEVVQRHRVLVGVHAVPEALVAEGVQLAVGGEALQRLALEHAVGVEIAERPGLEAEEATVDPVLAARLLGEAGDAVPLPELSHPPLQVRPHHRQRRQVAMTAVELEQRPEVDVGDAVGVGHAEALPVKPLTEPRNPPPGRRIQPGVDALDLDPRRPALRRRELRRPSRPCTR